MSYQFPSEEWTAAYRDAVNSNPKYQDAGKAWTFGPVAMVVTKQPDIGLNDDACMVLDVEGGECRGTTFHTGRESFPETPFVIEANYERWREVVEGKIDPIKAMMQNRLKLTVGHLPTMLRFVESSRQLVVSASSVPTQFMGA